MRSEKFEKIKQWLKDYDGPHVRLMEVCGSHTGAIAKNGIAGMLSPKIELLSGPGCPVCVAPSAYIDRLIELALSPNTTVVSFGDMIRVPGSKTSLSEAKGEGASVEMVYAPMDALALAKARPERNFVFAAVGFETTAPAYADLAHRLETEGVNNLKLLTAIKTMPAVIQHLLDKDPDDILKKNQDQARETNQDKIREKNRDEIHAKNKDQAREINQDKIREKNWDEIHAKNQDEALHADVSGEEKFLVDAGQRGIDGFLAPGHVSVITGASAFEPLAKRYGVPFVVAGFTGPRLIVAIYDLVRNRGNGIVKNDYPSVVTDEGNAEARSLVEKYFMPSTAVWRGMGAIPESGLILRKAYAGFDAGSVGLDGDVKKNAACICDQVLVGAKKPFDCPLFGKVCTPLQPQGACMVSSEGSCFSYHSNARDR